MQIAMIYHLVVVADLGEDVISKTKYDECSWGVIQGGSLVWL